MSDKNYAAEVTFAAGPDPISDAESPPDAVIFCSVVTESYAKFLNECAIIDNETFHGVDDVNDYLRDDFVKKSLSAPILFVEIEKDLVAHEEIFGADGSMAETS